MSSLGPAQAARLVVAAAISLDPPDLSPGVVECASGAGVHQAAFTVARLR